MLPMAVMYRHLDDPGTLKAHEGGQEAVQSPIHLDVFQHVRPHHLQGTAGVVDGVTGQAVADKIADSAADPF